MSQARNRNEIYRPYPGDSILLVSFFMDDARNEAKSLAEGYPIFDDVEMCRVTIPGSRETILAPAHSQVTMSPGEVVTYAERFPDDYERFAKGLGSAVSGMPIKEAPFLSKGEVSSLQALNVHTVEQLADMGGSPLKAMGPNGRKWQQSAVEFLARAHENRDAMAVAAEKAELMNRIAALENALATRGQPVPEPEAAFVGETTATVPEQAEVVDDEMSDVTGMTKEEIKDRIASLTGARPRGNPSLATLEKMLAEAEDA